MNTVYDPERWHDLFVMTGGAAAALAGLLFVAVSLNLDHILQYNRLPTLAAQSIATLVGLVATSVLALIPGQSGTALGVELVVCGVLLAGLVVVPTIGGLRFVARTRWRVTRVASALLCVVPLLTGAISLIAQQGGGLYWIVVQIVSALSVATYNAWILLIEIRR